MFDGPAGHHHDDRSPAILYVNDVPCDYAAIDLTTNELTPGYYGRADNRPADDNSTTNIYFGTHKHDDDPSA